MKVFTTTLFFLALLIWAPAQDHPEELVTDETSGVQDSQVPEEKPAEAPQAPTDPEPGISVRVESVRVGSTEIDAAEVKLLAPFPAKLLARSPQGWKVKPSETAPPVSRIVEISPGKNITLSVRPHLLVADANGSNVFSVAEPGFKAELGYRQTDTVAAILSNSVRQLEADSIKLGVVIDQLQQLVVSLPKPDPSPAPHSSPAPQPQP